MNDKKNSLMANRRFCVTDSTEHFHFSVSFCPDSHKPIEVFISGRRNYKKIDKELQELGIKISKIMRRGIKHDLPEVWR